MHFASPLMGDAPTNIGSIRTAFSEDLGIVSYFDLK